MMFLDHPNRRVRKATPSATHTYFWDGWLLVREILTTNDYPLATIDYHWGKDLSGSFQGAGGVGGLLYLKRDGSIYVPHYDAFGNITHYCDAQGNVVASYTYDVFGRTLSAIGQMADFFRHRFSTKYYDPETGFYYYDYRYYAPELARWTTRDPIGEGGGLNLYSFCGNDGVNNWDDFGQEPQNSQVHSLLKTSYEIVPITFEAWCIRKRNNPLFDFLGNIITIGLWGNREEFIFDTGENAECNDEISVPCADGTLFFRMYPHIGYPPEIGEPAKVPSKPQNPRGNSIAGGAANFPLPNATRFSASKLFGPSSFAGYDPTIAFPKGYPRYDYPFALFNIGRSFILKDIDGDQIDGDEKEGLWRSWNTIYHQPNHSDGSLSFHVNCGDLVEIEMGNVDNYEFRRKYRVKNYKSSSWRGSN